jgi:hypothetical protein
MTDNKIIDKIRKILELSKNNPSKEEAEAAALKAQKMLADYHISMSDLEECDPDDISGTSTVVGGTKKWRLFLAEAVANNFRCKFYACGKLVTFYGHATDIEVAKDTYEYLFNVAHKGACRERDAVHRIYGTSAGVYNGYCIGFVNGVKSALAKQCTALMLVTPKDVEESYADMSKSFATKRNSIHARGNKANIESAKKSGFEAGKDTMGTKLIG